MELNLAPGKYVVAVSGGVDSVALLDLLAQSSMLKAQCSFVVAHFDHGIRPDSEYDRLFVERLAEVYGLPFVYKREELGADASEALARDRRYAFLEQVREQTGSESIVTAHHADDDLETACINIFRGTYRKGLSSLHSTYIIRPLLPFIKDQIISYARARGLSWQEDSTNADTKYLRNQLRFKLLNADLNTKHQLLSLVRESAARNAEIDALAEVVFMHGYESKTQDFNRNFFISLPYGVSCEILAFWLRKMDVEFTKKNIELLCAQLKTARHGSRFNAGKRYFFVIDGQRIRLETV